MEASSDSYYDYYDDYEFNPYDSDTYPMSEPEVNHNEHQPVQQIPTPPVEIDHYDNRFAISATIDQSKEFIQQSLGIPVHKLRDNNIHGLVILRLEDFNAIRNDKRCGRIIPNVIFLDDPSHVGDPYGLKVIANQLHFFYNSIKNQINPQ